MRSSWSSRTRARNPRSTRGARRRRQLASDAAAPRARRSGRARRRDHPHLGRDGGAGKEVMAEHPRAVSARARGPLLKLNCAALSPSLIESELFGHERGAFTGASTPKRGLLQAAEGGTVFLDEIGELSNELERSSLRVIEERMVLPVGGLRAAPHRHSVRRRRTATSAAQSTKTVRQDLYYRLSGRHSRFPRCALVVRTSRPAHPLAPRDRRARAQSAHACARPGRGRGARRAAPPRRPRAQGHDDARALLLSDGGVTIRAADLQIEPTEVETSVAPAPTSNAERDRILAALDACGGNQTEAAKRLGIARRTLLYKLDALGVKRPRKGSAD
ncbi:MAG: sigma 54-interacting transcriptional regulator [Polyangiaceae bacterium]